MAPTDVESAAEELYGLPPGEFTSRRDELAAVARRSGDKDVAASVKALRRPTMGAWLANLLSRKRANDISALAEIGAQLRAGGKLAPPDLRRLSQQRHSMVRALVADAKRLASDAGQAAGPAVLDELTGTLEAAVFDQPSAEALMRGRLTTSLSYSGFGTLQVVAPAAAGRGTARSPGAQPAPGGPPAGDGATPGGASGHAAPGRRPATGRATPGRLRDAGDALAEAKSAEEGLAERLAAALERRDLAGRQVLEAQTRLDEARRAEDTAEREARALKRELSAAGRARLAAETALARAKDEAPKP